MTVRTIPVIYQNIRIPDVVEWNVDVVKIVKVFRVPDQPKILPSLKYLCIRWSWSGCWLFNWLSLFTVGPKDFVLLLQLAIFGSIRARTYEHLQTQFNIKSAKKSLISSQNDASVQMTGWEPTGVKICAAVKTLQLVIMTPIAKSRYRGFIRRNYFLSVWGRG